LTSLKLHYRAANSSSSSSSNATVLADHYNSDMTKN